MISVRQIEDGELKQKISFNILDQLKDWFEVDEPRLAYSKDSVDKLFWAAFDDDKEVGFVYLKETGKDTIELAVIGVLKEYHRDGIGRQLFDAACKKAKELGYSFIQVKTVKMGVYEEYDRTNLFYIGLGFKEFEVITSIWDEANPCQIYIKEL